MKLIKIQSCDQCHHFDDHYYSYRETCKLKNRKVEVDPDADYGIRHPFPSWCPLEDVE